MISTPDAVLQAVIKRALIESGCPSHIVNDLMENAHERAINCDRSLAINRDQSLAINRDRSLAISRDRSLVHSTEHVRGDSASAIVFGCFSLITNLLGRTEMRMLEAWLWFKKSPKILNKIPKNL